MTNSGEMREQIGLDEVTGGQKQLRGGEEIEMSYNDADVCSETDKLPSHNNDLLNMIWKTMEKYTIEWDRVRRGTEEKKEKDRRDEKAEIERNRRENNGRLKQHSNKLGKM
jgi:hypothetical protein